MSPFVQGKISLKQTLVLKYLTPLILKGLRPIPLCTTQKRSFGVLLLVGETWTRMTTLLTKASCLDSLRVVPGLQQSFQKILQWLGLEAAPSHMKLGYLTLFSIQYFLVQWGFLGLETYLSLFKSKHWNLQSCWEWCNWKKTRIWWSYWMDVAHCKTGWNFHSWLLLPWPGQHQVHVHVWLCHGRPGIQQGAHRQGNGGVDIMQVSQHSFREFRTILRLLLCKGGF